MRTVGIDPGDRWFGLAISDPSGVIARPLEVVDGREEVLSRLEVLVRDEEVERVVVGLPRNMDGTIGPRAEHALALRDALDQRLGVPVTTWDERLTTFQAETLLRESGLSSRQIQERIDMVAAQILLQSFLDAHRREA